jgi:hypothetical protein
MNRSFIVFAGVVSIALARGRQADASALQL